MKARRYICLLLVTVLLLGLFPTFALADGESTEPRASSDDNQYLSDITLTRTAISEDKLYMKSDTQLSAEFEFNPAQREYDIILEDTSPSSCLTAFISATLKPEYESAGLSGSLTKAANPTLTSEMSSSSAHATVHYITGKFTETGTDIAFEDTDIYTYGCSNLERFMWAIKLR